MAIPYPAWPEPGKLVTPELDRAFSDELQLWIRSRLLLQDCILHTWYKLCKSPDLSTWYDEKLTAERWNFLVGLWQGRHMEIPSQEQMETWAREWAAWKPQEPAEE
jgi:hypothetical protein